MNTRRRPIAPSPNIYATNVKICHLVAQHTCLYDRSDENYMRKSTVKNAWKEISKEMRISVKGCKDRWRNIRTSYARSIKVHHGANTYYLKGELQFLQKHITPGVPVPLRGRRSRPKGQEELDEQDDGQHETPVEAMLEMKMSPSSPETEHAQSRDSNDSQSEEESDDEQRSWQARASKRQRLESKESKTSNYNVEASQTMDFDDAFLQGLRPEIKHMNFHQKLYFKRRVYELLGEIFHSDESASSSHPTHPHPAEKVNGTLPTASPSPSPSISLQHLGMLQLPKLGTKPAKDV
ncbi:uncharacterized protein LOC108034579 [Drosophila biarmipes]|uniref:uncharacterized protein LOC108034579 n=1 Tax=Drosophila biarmipes TaxID=125945 RepID=UPI0007E6F2D1|nr:uncharacterized protein LOC108034579 [Drosophila biarmipes]